jgi:osmoprotectant transport system ATP-binding protein
MLQLRQVSKRYPDGTWAVRDLTLEVERGELVVLVGPSGCGKTTTLRMVNRMVEPSAGQVLVGGRDVREQDPVRLRRGIGYVVQQVGLFPHMTVAQNIEVVPRLLGWPPPRRAARVDELLHLAGMDPAVYRDRYPHELSGGQQQRVGVLRALAADPDLILMDEPFGALDPISREQLQNELRSLQRTFRKTVVLVTHDMDEALRLADRVAILRAGRLLQYGTPAEVLRQPADPFVAEFLGRHRLAERRVPSKVREVMDRRPAALAAERSAEEAFALMQSRQVDTLLVTDRRGELVGRVSVWQLAGGRGAGRTLGEICERDVPVAAPDEQAADAFARMEQGRLPYLAVVEGRRLVGIVTRRSVVRALAAAVWGEGQ